jgi:predicted nucleic-acid-binding Zn-ribbon protein
MSIHEPGICPKCGQVELVYGSGQWEDGNYAYECSCSECGYTGQEMYDLIFAGHTDDNDPTGAFIE